MSSFEALYIAVRKKEGRLYTIDQIRKLPFADKADPLSGEWEMRADTAKRFVKYLHEEKRFLTILEIGCGNGWFSNYIVKNTKDIHVTGQDINQLELKLAGVAFRDPRLTWNGDDLFSIQHKFDLAVLNSSVHYFPDLKKVTDHLCSLLTENGEIHILDSPFYQNAADKKAAHERTKAYYGKLGHPELAEFYSPHLFSDLDPFHYQLMYDPKSSSKLLQKLSRKKRSPFPWICIRK
jgi:SAM-dependent methyltransferase